ncbi:MAG: glyoxalase/Bleomycin resistance protein/dioxygenase [Amnibacterium sp.]|nr:glyoxalase/Bleomycin resistance protein/dioxygenase [Amnibacterium sp.]
MLNPVRLSAVLASTDLARSQEFYEQTLGLPLSSETVPNHLLFDTGTGTLLIYGRPAANRADHTQVRVWTSDIDRDVHDLAERGVVFEDYDFPRFKTVAHIATTAGLGRSAWFKDPDGNTIALFQAE